MLARKVGRVPKEAVILSAGEGLRLGAISSILPKCLIEVKGRLLLQYQMDHLRQFGITKVVVAVQNRFETVMRLGMQDGVTLSLEDEPHGTAATLKQALKYIEGETLMVINADDIADIDINEVANLGAPTICIYPARSNFGVVHLDGNEVLSFEEKPSLPYHTSLGWYHLSTDTPLPDVGSLERDVFPDLAAQGVLRAHYHGGFWVTINTLKDIKEAEEVL